jgi:hypothetical protein
VQQEQAQFAGAEHPSAPAAARAARASPAAAKAAFIIVAEVTPEATAVAFAKAACAHSMAAHVHHAAKGMAPALAGMVLIDSHISPSDSMALRYIL